MCSIIIVVIYKQLSKNTFAFWDLRGGGGSPIQVWGGGGVHPSSPNRGEGVGGHPGPDRGCTPIQVPMGVYPHPVLGRVTPIGSWLEVPPPHIWDWKGYPRKGPGTSGQTDSCENITSRRTTYAGGKYLLHI